MALALVKDEELEESVADDETSASVTGYDFDEDFQIKIVALALRDAGFAQRTDGLIRPEYFENEADAAITKVALDYYDTYKRTPDRKSIGTLLKSAVLDRRIRKDLVDDVRERIKTVLAADISDREFVADNVARFARHRAYETAILEAAELLIKGDYDKIEKIVQKAQDVGISEEGEAYDYWAEIENRTTERVDLAAGLIKPDGISTGIADLDKYLYHQGWGRKELSVLMGAAKAGKSMSLGEFGKNASLLGYNVYYASLEVSRKIIADRVDANVADTAIRLLKDSPHTVKGKIDAAGKKAGKFFIEDFPSGTLKVSALRRRLEQFRRKGISFDLIIVDYADIMAAERFTGDLKDDMRQIYIDLRAIAFTYNAAVLTATQTNREGAKATVAKMTDVAEDFNKIRTADIVISINAVEEERKSGEARLYFAAHRNGESNFTLRIKQDREKMKFLTKVLGKE
ncbi:replicative DNA helicase [Faunimonas pinastri]|uniref:Replicative DNA helicase n=1 Tax=Faunimonas pinastri TaxID=1855383 RepID=A0A1H9N0C4_9HYPH|nr:DnaB-like helicase C-terminal domain-containing protein [Faunimonas pinastri]SER29426.1 replicative DNA helicase [Faunimonas pinastri]